MKKLLLILTIILFARTLAISQVTLDTLPQLKRINGIEVVLIAPEQLKQANKFIAERNIFKRANDSLKAVTSYYQYIYQKQIEIEKNLKQQIDLKDRQLGVYDERISSANKNIEKLDKKLKRTKTQAIVIGAGAAILSAIIFK